MSTSGMQTSNVRLELSPSPVSIAIGRSVIRRIVTFRDSDAESSFLVAFTEILANAVDEHRRLGLEETIAVEITQGPTESVRVIDAGSGIRNAGGDGMDAAADSVSERGRGLALARAFVEDLELESSTEGTAATLPLKGFGIVR